MLSICLFKIIISVVCYVLKIQLYTPSLSLYYVLKIQLYTSSLSLSTHIRAGWHVQAGLGAIIVENGKMSSVNINAYKMIPVAT